MSARKKEAPWVKVDMLQQLVVCERCGDSDPLRLPMSVSTLLKFLAYAAERHLDCVEASS